MIILLIVAAAAIAGGIVWIVRKVAARRMYAETVSAAAEKANEVRRLLDRLFLPDKRATQKDLDQLLAENSSTLEEAAILCDTPTKYESILAVSGLREFVIDTAEARLQARLKENNEVRDAIDLLSTLCADAMKRYEVLTADDHYFAFSEMERFKQSLSDIEICEETVFPDYAEFVNDEAVKRLLDIKKNLEKIRQEHNSLFVERELADNKGYFDTVLGKYPLDPQQRDSIVKLEDNCLVIASAGSGKTSTILGKAKYLVERRKIDPAKVLLITYTRKAANELHERMKIEGMTCSTFHALAYRIIGEVTGAAPSICDGDMQLNLFYRLLDENPNFLHAVNNYIINQQSMMRLEHEYRDSFEYYEDRKKYGIQALFPDMDGKIIFTKSEEEKRLVSILTRMGVTFRYENAYQYNTATPDRRQYKPDFTIYFQDGQGNLRWVYLEHFGIDSVGNVPLWFGEGNRGGWSVANQKYNEGIAWKRNIHSQNRTVLIETTSADFADGTVEEKLRAQLTQWGVPIRERSDKELYQMLVSRSRKLEKSVFTLIQSFITLMKANEKTIDGLVNALTSDRIALKQNLRNLNILVDIIKPFYEEYEQTLQERYEIDFTDAIIQATKYCREGLWRHYDYILVDEFQDISVDRYKFLQALRSEEPQTKLYCVGDDWQSIFRFAGSDMSLFYEFEQYFGYTEQCKIETTYRFHQPLIDKSSEFIIRNKEQKVKTIKTPAGDTKKTWLNFEKCDGEDRNGVLKKVEEIVAKIPADQSVLLLGRYNYDAMSVGFTGKLDMKDNRIMVRIGVRDVPFLSVHSAKGLEADNVILVNCNQGAYGFPSLIEDDPILDFVLSKKEGYPFAEERRLFYVAMTRARMKMYVLYDQRKPSPFIEEFLVKLEVGSYLCPKCMSGKLSVVKEGKAANGSAYRCYKCSNSEGGCDYFETVFGEFTPPPGIKITDKMTAQDIERMREGRRQLRIR